MEKYKETMYHEEINFPTWFLILEAITLIALFLFTIVSFLLYFVEIQIIYAFRKTTFRGPFYRLMFVGIIVDIISAINLFTGQVIPARRWLEPFLIHNQNWLGSMFFVITYGGRCIQGATATILSACRVSAVCFPIFYQKLSHASYIYVMQFIQLIGAVVALILLGPDTYEYIVEDNGLYSVGSDDTDAEWFYTFASIMELIFVFFIVVNNIITYTMFKIKFNKRNTLKKNSISPSQFQTSQEKQKRENGLDKMTFIVCLVELIYFSFVVYSLQINQSMNKRVFYFLYNILCVIYSTFSAWMLFIVSKPINTQFYQRFSLVRFSLVRYFVEIQIIYAFRKTTFRGPFYRLMFVGIIVDIISAINLFTGQVIPARRLLEPFLIHNQNWLGSIFFVITYGGRGVQGATATILSFCRVSAVCFPIFYQKLSQPSYIYVMQFIQLIGAVVALILLVPDTYEYIVEDNGLYSVGYVDTDAGWFYTFASIMELIFVFFIVVNNIVTYSMFKIKFNKRNTLKKNSISPSQFQTSQEKQKRENGLDKMTFIVCLLELIYFSFVVYALQINQSMRKRVFYFFYNILCVIYSTFSAWMLLTVSKPINTQFYQKFSKLNSRRTTRTFSISVQGSRSGYQ